MTSHINTHSWILIFVSQLRLCSPSQSRLNACLLLSRILYCIPILLAYRAFWVLLIWHETAEKRARQKKTVPLPRWGGRGRANGSDLCSFCRRCSSSIHTVRCTSLVRMFFDFCFIFLKKNLVRHPYFKLNAKELFKIKRTKRRQGRLLQQNSHRDVDPQWLTSWHSNKGTGQFACSDISDIHYLTFIVLYSFEDGLFFWAPAHTSCRPTGGASQPFSQTLLPDGWQQPNLRAKQNTDRQKPDV